MELDATDSQIIQLLQQDGRMSNTDLAARIHLQISIPRTGDYKTGLPKPNPMSVRPSYITQT